MNHPHPSDLISSLFILLNYIMLALVLMGYGKAMMRSGVLTRQVRRRTLVAGLLIIFWLVLLKYLAANHILDDWNAMPPRIMIVVLPPLVFMIYLMFSKRVKIYLRAIPSNWLIFIQSYRILVELILFRLLVENVIPVQMSFEGRNWDILTGITALIAGYFTATGRMSRRAIILWNVFGLILLINIVTVAILSTPLPIRSFMNEPANTVVAYFPFVWLPGFIVPVAYTMHALSIRKELLKT
jgi:hypothetical protein